MRMAKASALALVSVMFGASFAVSVAAFDPTDPADALRDPDGDGLTNIEEFLRGRRQAGRNGTVFSVHLIMMPKKLLNSFIRT